ncbi:MAG TPA: hypothetical protein VEG08_01555 [Terriglobales bacterium]|nr:hypothetical protein [Terriglobales bacterium]
MITKLRVVIAVFALVLVLGAQQVPEHHPRDPQAPPGAAPDINIPPDMQREMAKQRNKERQESLKKDTDRLFQLATELKQSVDKSNENVMSIDVIRKAEEIEKLAKQVKEKMKG